MKIVCLSGWKGSGKDLCANYLTVSGGFKRVAFADTLKDMVAKEYGIPRSHCDDQDYKEKPILSLPVCTKDGFTKYLASYMVGEFRRSDGTPAPKPYPTPKEGQTLIEAVEEYHGKLFHCPRSLCILKGSSNRMVDSAYWVKAAVEKMKENPDGLYVISDIRYRSEAEQLAEFAGRNNVMFIRINRFKESPSEDPSERDLDNFDFDYVLDNTGTKQETLSELSACLGLFSFADPTQPEGA